jgi:glycosyltransferase involved in cell wall biosynthesis
MNTSKPLVSGIVIFLNEERFIREAIESVFAQTYGNWELLLVDDGSTDGSTQIALQCAKQYPTKVRYLEHPGHQNRGMSVSRNLGISHAEGQYIAFLDADDVWLPHKLQQQIVILGSQPEAAMLYGNTLYWHSWTGNPEDSQCDWLPELRVQANTLIKPPRLLTLLYPLGNGRTPSSSNLLLRREAVGRTGGFEESFKGIYEDQAFLAKVCLNESVFVASESEYWDKYRQHPDSCFATVTAAGQRLSARLKYLNWLEEYLSEQGFKDPEVWKLLREQQLVTKVEIYLREREWKQAMQAMLVLLRYHPTRFGLYFKTLIVRACQKLYRLGNLAKNLR